MDMAFLVQMRRSNKCESINDFKSMSMQFFTLKQRSLFLIHNQIGVNLLTINHKFKDCTRLMYNYGSEIEATKHFFCVANPLPVKGIISMTTVV